MKLLALDTTLGACSAAVLCTEGDRQKLYARFEERARGHAEALMPMVADVLAEAGVGYDELDRIALTRGPGTFTGVRIGVAAARGLALATGAALFATDSLSVIAADARERWQQENDGGARPQQLAALVDARRGEVYFALYDAKGACLHAPAVVTRAEALRLIGAPEGTLAAGSGVAAMRELLPDRGFLAAYDALQPDARVLARLALTGEPCASPPSQLYLRQPDAKPQDDAALPRRQPHEG